MNNPYLPAQAQAITNQVNNNLQQQQLPGINSNAIAAGGFGGSRQGIAQGLAIGQTNQALGNSLANLYGQAYEGDQNRANQMSIAQMNDATQRFGLQNSYNLGLGNLALGNKQADNSYSLGLGNLGLGQMQANQNFYTAQRGQDLQQTSLGANLMQMGNQGIAQGGQGLYNAGQLQQQAPLNAIQSYAQLLDPFTGLNATRTESMPGASRVGSALGGAMTAAQIWNLLTNGGKQ